MSTAVATRQTTRPEGTVAASALLRAVMAVKPLAVPTYRKKQPAIPPRIRVDWTIDALTVTATNGEAWASYRIESAVCVTPGSVVIQAGLLATVARTVGKITVHAGEPVPEGVSPDLVVMSEAGTSRIRTMPFTDWPEEPEVPDAPTWPVDPSHLRAVLSAASTETSRPILQAIAFQDGAMVATDSYRLHYIDGGLPAYPGLLIPESALRWVAKETEPVLMVATSDIRPVVRIVGGSQAWTVRTADGGWHKHADTGERVQDRADYVAWRKLPEMYPTTNRLTIDRTEILRAIRHCLSIMPGTVDPIKVEVKHDGIRFVRTISDVCTLEASTVGKLDGPEIAVAFSGSYLRDAIAAGSGDSVTVHMFDPIRPAVITDDGPCRRLLMPVRLA